MNSTLSKAFIFVTGAAIGSFVTWKLLKTKYERIADEEIADMSAYYEKKLAKLENDLDEAQEELGDMVDEIEAREYVEKYEEIVRGYNGAQLEKDVADAMRKPEVISPDEFGEIDLFDTETLFYCSDGVLIDSDNNPIEDVDNLVGKESLTHFGEYEDDSVFVRNYEQKTDYEILLEPRAYSDVINTGPHQAEGE